MDSKTLKVVLKLHGKSDKVSNKGNDSGNNEEGHD